MKNLSQLHKKYIAAAALLLLAAFMGLACFVWGGQIIGFVSDGEKFRRWVNSGGRWAKAGFVLMMAFQIVLAFIPGEPLEIGAGYAFGVGWGTVLCLAGSLLGSVIVFAAVRVLGRRLVYLFFKKEDVDRLSFLQDEKRLNMIIFTLFLIPGTPKDIMSYFVGLSKMKLGSWIFISTFARFPSIITSTAGGSLAGSGNYIFAAAVFALTAAAAAAGMAFYTKTVGRR